MVYVQHNLATWYNPRKAYMDPQTIDANKVMEVTMMKVDRLMTVSRVNGSSRISFKEEEEECCGILVREAMA